MDANRCSEPLGELNDIESDTDELSSGRIFKCKNNLVITARSPVLPHGNGSCASSDEMEVKPASNTMPN